MSTMTADTERMTLRNMPEEVRQSALRTRPDAVGEGFRTFDAHCTAILTLATMVAPVVLVACLVMGLPIPGTSEHVADARRWSTVYGAALLAACIGYRLLFELAGCVPRRDPRYPLIAASSRLPGLLTRRSATPYPLSWIILAYAALLWLSWCNGWQSIPSARNTLWYAIINTAIGCAAYAYGALVPAHGYRLPDPADVADQQLRRELAAPAARPQPSPEPTAPRAPEYATPIETREPRLRFESLHGMDTLKRQMIEAAEQILMPRRTHAEPARNGILLHGEPGNGKTVFAEALAGELGLPLVTMTFGDIASKWLGEMPRVITNCFSYAKDSAPCVMFIDEVDSFIRSRDAVPVGDDLKVANTMLTQIVALREHPVVLVAATNFLSTLDPAAIREGRFDYKVEVTAPDERARAGILRDGIARHAPQLEIDDTALTSVARRWSGFSTSRLVAVTRAIGAHAAEQGVQRVGFNQWMGALRAVQGRRGSAPASSKQLSELFLDPRTAEALGLISRRLRAACDAERLGAALPSGVLLHGPSGTGKTLAAQALAVESGWAFLPVAGPDLMGDPDRLAKLYREACDLRPALVFIDEADQLLQDRRFNPRPELVNRLLTLTDGAQPRVGDVIVLVATNDPQQIDPALLRPGRFTEKVAFLPPPHRQLVRAVEVWLQKKRVRLAPDLGASDVANQLRGRTVADTEGVLQYALNRAVFSSDGLMGTAQLSRNDLTAAMATVLP